jgi:glycosyltransferase involved in cell wall biosynthesis
VADDIVAVHDEGGTQVRPDRGARRTADFSREYYYFNIRNRLLFAELHLDAAGRRSWYLHSARESYRILLRGIGKRQFLPPWRPIALAARALRDGRSLGRAARKDPGARTGTRSDTSILGDHVPPRTPGPPTGRRAAAAGDAVVSGVAPHVRRTVRILGTHGVPAAYGGFETAAENVALHLRDHGWRVIVYCQESGSGELHEDVWRGIERVIIPVRREGWLGTSEFDLRSIRHAVRHGDLCLTFGYNTAIFNVLQRLRRIPNVFNMDGIEWSRARWGKARQAILWTNERIACVIGDHLIADHPSIERYLATRAPASKISTITYGAHAVEHAPEDPVRSRGLEPGAYLTLICRPIPENSILELVTGFSAAHRGVRLAVLGTYLPDEDPYHRAVMDAASDEVVFLGSVYDPDELAALRFHGLAYLHGHTVGGTNPSLVEAMAAGNPVIAHDNEYNRWVAGDAARYFRTPAQVAEHVEALLGEPELRRRMSAAARERHRSEFTWEHVAGQYEALLERFAPRAPLPGPPPQTAVEEGTR